MLFHVRSTYSAFLTKRADFRDHNTLRVCVCVCVYVCVCVRARARARLPFE
jgi:hypothetical protein